MKLEDLNELERLEVEYVKARASGDGSLAERMAQGSDPFARIEQLKPMLNQFAAKLVKEGVTSPQDVEKRAIANLYPSNNS